MVFQVLHPFPRSFPPELVRGSRKRWIFEFSPKFLSSPNSAAPPFGGPVSTFFPINGFGMLLRLRREKVGSRSHAFLPLNIRTPTWRGKVFLPSFAMFRAAPGRALRWGWRMSGWILVPSRETSEDFFFKEHVYHPVAAFRLQPAASRRYPPFFSAFSFLQRSPKHINVSPLSIFSP